MGNQTMVPSQIQSAESYFLDLKNFAQFKSSLGSTAFMKTAIVNLIEDALLGLPDQQTLSTLSTQNATLHSSNALSSNLSVASASSSSSASVSASASSSSTAQQQQQLKLNQLQLLKQRIQELRELQQLAVVKIFPKYDLTIQLDLYSKRVREIKNIIYSTYGLYTNCLPFSEMIITERAAFLFRQYIKYNLYDRLSTRPFLTHIEKKWIAFQLISAVNEIHSLQIVHGDLKTENVLVNSFLWVSLADFASYKPVYLSKNHPSADFNYYFDISRRRTCYLAPERLDTNRETKSHMTPPTNQNILSDHDAGLDGLVPPDPNDFQPSMDIFSLGCVLAELFMERPLFDFAHLLSYKDRKYDPTGELVNEIRDKSILEMIFSMLSHEASARSSANEYLQEQNDKAFPSYFVYLKNYIKGFVAVKLTPDEVVIRLRNDLPLLLKNFKLNLNENTSSDNTSQGLFTEIKLTNSEHHSSTTDTNDAFLILLSLLLSCIRKVKFNENKLIAIDLLSNFSKFLDDSVILDRILPYYTSLIEEPNQSAIVKSHVIYALNDCLSNIYNLDLQNINIFPEIIFNILEQLSRDESFLVRATVAKTISNFALTSLRYLDTGFLIKRSMQSNDTSNTSNDSDMKSPRQNKINFDKSNENKFGSYDKEHELYQTRITEIVMHLITDLALTSTSANAVKETLIRSDISKLCSFFSRQKTSEFLLPHMITILNEKTDWSVRAAFFDALCPVLSCIGWESVEIVKSLLEQGLRDSEEFVIHRTLITLSKMVEIGLLDRQQICYFLSNHITALLCHPSLWIRHGAVNFICVVCKQQNTKLSYKKQDLASLASMRDDFSQNNNGLNTADVLCSVAPLLTKFLDRKDLINYDKEEILFHCLKKPIKRAVYDCISQDGRSDQLFLYLTQRSEIRCLTNQNYLPGYVDCSDPNVQQFFEKLCKLGFVEEDEDKLLHMKDFMDKTRISRLSSSLHNADMSLSNNSNNTSVLNPSWNATLINNSNTKENFILKDGCINLMREKFQKFNCEFLNNRKLPGLDSTEKLYKLNSPSNQQIKIDETTNTLIQTSNEASNPEWRIMFGDANKQPQQQQQTNRKSNLLKHSESLYQLNKPQLQQQQQLQANQYLLNHNFKNCILEVDRYLDRCKYAYEDHKIKKMRVERAKESVNSSISSNSVCLTSKWKPKGYLLVHSNEHTKEITKLSRNFDSSYFSTCSHSEASVKIWTTDNLLDGKSGFFKSIFTYDKQTSMAARGQNQEGSSIRPCCTTFYDKNSLAILGEDFKFHVIDFNSSRTQYHLFTHEKLFKPTICNCSRANPTVRTQFDKTTFYYLNRAYKNNNLVSLKTAASNNKTCSYCTNNFPIEMIYIDDSCPTWQAAATNANDYFRSGTIGSTSKGLFCYSTSIGDFSCIDLRTRSKAFEIKRDLRKGYITTMITDPWYTWLAMGTSYGNIELYDFRFMLPVQTFEHRSKTAVAKLAIHPTLTNRLIASYQANNEISIWNMDASQNVYKTKNKLNTVDPEFVFWGVQSVPPLSQKNLSSCYNTGLISVSSGDDNGLICASTDMKIRYIDLNEGNRDSFIISTPFNFQSGSKLTSDMNIRNSSKSSLGNAATTNFEFANSLMSNNVTYELRQIEGTKVLLELDQYSSGQYGQMNNANATPQSFSYNSPALTHQTYFTHHQDAISDLIVCYNQFNSKNPPLIITSARDGALKIWR